MDEDLSARHVSQPGSLRPGAWTGVPGAVSRISPMVSGPSRRYVARPASVSLTALISSRFAEPDSTNRTPAGFRSTCCLMAESRPGARWASSMTTASTPAHSSDGAERAWARVSWSSRGKYYSFTFSAVKPCASPYQRACHTFASLLINQGENLKYVQQQLGHASITRAVDRLRAPHAGRSCRRKPET